MFSRSVIGAGMIAGAMLFGTAATAAADPPNCTAADLAGVMSGVSAGTSSYLFTHPDVNAFFTGLKGKPRDQMTTEIQAYFDANPRVRDELQAVRQAAADFRDSLQRAVARHADGLVPEAPDVAASVRGAKLTHWSRARHTAVLAHRHGRRARPRGTRATRRRRVPAAVGGPRTTLPRPDEQLDLHPAGPVRPAPAFRPDVCRKPRSGRRRWPPRRSWETSCPAGRPTSSARPA